MSSLTTLAGRSKMAKARAGIADLPKIAGMVLGDGGVDDNGTVLDPGEILGNELLRRDIDNVSKVSDTCYRYSLKLAKTDLPDANISEMGLYDADGDIVAIKTFKTKIKDADMEMIFEMDDQF